MGIIEQATQRLEELRRSGIEVPQRTVPIAPTRGSTVADLPARAASRFEDLRRSTATPRSRPEEADVGRGKDRGDAPLLTAHVEIDLARLDVMGYVTPQAPRSQIADEFRVIKRPIIQNAVGRAGGKIRSANLVMVTSALPAEGKTFTALNLAMSVAMEYDHTVLLVDGDVAHPGLPRLLGVPEAPGLLDLLTNDKLDVGDALVKTNVEKLSVLPAGTAHRRATELLASEQMAALLAEIATRYEDRIIIFDSPPLLATTEARVLATHMGQIVMVVAAESTSQNTLNQAMATIESCEIVLMMLNKASRTEAGTYGYYAGDDVR